MRKKHVHLKVEQLSEGNALPLELAWRDSGGGLLAAFGMAALFLVLAFTIGDMIPEGAFSEHTTTVKEVLPVALIAFALLRLIRALLLWKTENHVEVDGHTVTVTMKRWLKSHQWSEPLANYDGVRWKRYVIHSRANRDSSHRTNDQPRFWQVIELAHPDGAKTVPLAVKKTGQANVMDTLALLKKSFSASEASDTERAELESEARRLAKQASGDDLRPRWEAMAASLGLPAIDARDGASEVRQAEDLDKSIRQLADDGRIEADWKGGAPPSSLAVEQRGSADDPAAQALHLTIHAASVPKPVFYIIGGMGIFFFLLGVLNLDFGAVVGGLLLGGAALGIWYLQRNNPNQITITREEIRYRDPLVQRRSFVMPLSEIESIKILDRDSESASNRTLKISGKELLLSTDRTERAVGAGLDDNELEWLRGYLVAAIARA